jgi:ATP-dependent protease Clp ATPase subunit
MWRSKNQTYHHGRGRLTSGTSKGLFNHAQKHLRCTFCIADTYVLKAGYVGEDVESILLSGPLLQAADYKE